MECVLAGIFDCDKSEKELTIIGTDRIASIISASKSRLDSIHIDIEKILQSDSSSTILCHRDCVSTYTSSWHISRHLKRSSSALTRSSPLPSKRSRRSDVEKFNFRENCLYCGEYCQINPDPKNPKRW